MLPSLRTKSARSSRAARSRDRGPEPIFGGLALCGGQRCVHLGRRAVSLRLTTWGPYLVVIRVYLVNHVAKRRRGSGGKEITASQIVLLSGAAPRVHDMDVTEKGQNAHIPRP